MKQLLLRLKRFCGYLAGFVFFISGILKLMDPVGSSLVMKEYFQFLHIGFMDFSATTAGVIFALAETIIGAGLITGVWRKIIACISIGLQGFFTLLTLLLVIFQPKMDCGCFGEAVHLSHGETFGKNLILLTLLLIYYIPAKHLGETKKKKYVSFGIVCLSVAAFCLYSLLYIPMTDFTDLHPGVIINSAPQTAENTYEAVFVYEKDGQTAEFTLDNLPDSTWTYVSTLTTGNDTQTPSAANISIYDQDGNYADSLLTQGRIIIASFYNDDISQKQLDRTKAFLAQAQAAGFTPVLLTVSGTLDLPYHYFCDYKTLITLNRSNGGATYVDNGSIIRKWSKRTLPDPEDLTTMSEEDSTETFIGRDAKTGLAFQGFLLYVFAVMLLL
ncbi:MAG: hypothetical protein E7111_05965 [Bacteroidales bacterium]|nr:hypothetical protein [Bacteroidales bacterium]